MEVIFLKRPWNTQGIHTCRNCLFLILYWYIYKEFLQNKINIASNNIILCFILRYFLVTCWTAHWCLFHMFGAMVWNIFLFIQQFYLYGWPGLPPIRKGVGWYISEPFWDHFIKPVLQQDEVQPNYLQPLKRLDMLPKQERELPYPNKARNLAMPGWWLDITGNKGSNCEFWYN